MPALVTPRRWPSALLCLLGAACSAAAAGRDDAPNEVVVRAADFAYRAPDTIPAGVTRIRLVNDGREMHHAQLVRIAPGHTLDELLARLAARERPAWATWVGGPDVALPRGAGEVVAALTPGQYALLCFISSPSDHRPHVTKGMARALTVVPAAGRGAAEPAADVRMVLDDYTFTATPAIRAGRHTIRVVNAAEQPHEVAIVRLEPGRTAADVLAWARAQNGPPPGEPIGGTATLATGESNLVTATFTPGEYALFCFAPDAKDGKPHVAHGMVRQFRVD
jgi:hypothetical protein